MNDPSLNPSSEQELETRITAVVLGEASDFERDQIDRLIEQRPDLAAMKARFESVHCLLHDVGREEWPVDDDGEWKLPGKKREALLDVLAGNRSDIRLAAAPEASRSAGKLSRFTKIGALICAACLVVALGVWNLAAPRQMAMTSMVQSARERSFDTTSEIADAPKSFLPARGSERPDGPSGMGMDTGSMDIGRSREAFDQPADAGLRYSSSASRREGIELQAPTEEAVIDAKQKLAEGAKGDQSYFGQSLSKSLKDALPSPYYLQDDVQYFPSAPLAPEPRAESASSDFGVQGAYAGRAAGQSGEVALSLGDDKQVPNGTAERPSSISSRQAMGGMRSNGRLSEAEEVAALAKELPLAAVTGKPQSAAIEQAERALDFAEPSSRGELRRSRSQLLETAESESGLEMSVEPRELKNRLYEEVPTDSLDVTAGVKLPQLRRESISELSTELFESDSDRSQLQSAPAKKERDLDQLRRATEKRKESQPRVESAPEFTAATEPFSTFSLHVSDVSFKLAAAALAQGRFPEPDKVRIEEFVNALDYGDPLPRQHEQVAGQIEQCIDPFAQQRNLLRVSLRTAAAGRASTTPLRLTLLLDNSGSMERIDRQQTVRRAFETLTQQLQAGDQITLVSFARTPRLLADRVSGEGIKKLVQLIENLPSEGGTNIETALQLAWEKAREQWTEGAQNRIILLTDGAVNLGDADPERLSNLVTTIRDSGIAFDAAGISANGLNDEVLEALTRKGDGRYYLLDSVESADDGFARQIAGALRPSAMNVKVQVEFNSARVGHYRLLGFEKHRLNQEDFRNDKVDAAEMAAAEAGVAVYQFEPNPDGEGDVGSVSVRFRDRSSGQMVERRWPILYQPNPPRVDQSPVSMRLATVAAMLAAKLGDGPLGETVDLQALSALLAGLPPQDRVAPRVRQLEQMIQQAREISGG